MTLPLSCCVRHNSAYLRIAPFGTCGTFRHLLMSTWLVVSHATSMNIYEEGSKTDVAKIVTCEASYNDKVYNALIFFFFIRP